MVRVQEGALWRWLAPSRISSPKSARCRGWGVFFCAVGEGCWSHGVAADGSVSRPDCCASCSARQLAFPGWLSVPVARPASGRVTVNTAHWAPCLDGSLHHGRGGCQAKGTPRGYTDTRRYHSPHQQRNSLPLQPLLAAFLEPGSVTFQVKMIDSQLLRIPPCDLLVGAIGASACAMAFPAFGDLTPNAHLHLLSKQGCGRATGYAGGYDRAWIQ